MTMLRQIDPPPSEEDALRLCGNCGYDVRGNVEPRCPECGAPFDPARLPTARLPWFHRHSTGRCRAICATLLLVLMQQLADETNRRTQLDLAAARSFRKLCVIVAATSIALAIALPARDGRAEVWSSTVLMVFLLLLMLFHWLTMPLNVPHGPSTTKAARRATLYHFAAAPLLLMPVVPFAAAMSRLTHQEPPAMIIWTVIVTMPILAIWIACTLNFHRRARVYGFGMLMRDLLVPALVLALGAGLAFALLVAGAAFSTRLIDW